MKFPCEILSDPYLTQIRRTAAKRLHENGLTQMEIANLLQVSQPLVSNYLKKDGIYTSDVQNQISDMGILVGEKVAKILEKDGVKGTPKALAAGCAECKIIRQNGVGCLLHKLNTTSLADDCTSCHSTSNIIDLQIYRGSIIDELNDLLGVLVNNSKLHYIIPEIGMQIVSGITNFKSVNDIAAFPGRIRKKKRGLLSTEYPTFGSSETLAGLLIKFNSKHQYYSTIAAIKTSEWLLEKCENSDIEFTIVRQFDQDYDAGISEISDRFLNLPSPIIIYNEGNIGFEDISYVICKDLKELNQVLLQLKL